MLGVLFLAYDLALDAGADLPGGDLRVLSGFLFVAAVAILGAWLTYLVVPQPGRPGQRSGWSAALGLFAALPIAYLALVLLFQVVKPLLAGLGGEPVCAPALVRAGAPQPASGGCRSAAVGVRSARHHPAGPSICGAGPHTLEDMTVAADPDPYFALP